MSRPKSVAVIGAGLAGLTAAHRLATAGVRVTLLDAAQRSGGWVSTTHHRLSVSTPDGIVEDKVTLEAGPRSIRPRGISAASMLQLISDVELSDEIMSIPVTHPAAKNRYLLNTKTQALERVALSLTKTPEAVRALVRGAVLEPFRRRGNGDDESVASFFKRRFGPAAAGVASAFVHGIYAADPDKLSVRAAFGILTAAEKRYGSVVLGMLLGARTTAEKEAEKAAWASVGQLGQDRAGWSMYALRRGMQSLTDRLEERIRHAGGDVLLGTPVQRIENGDGVKVHLPESTLSVDHVVAALPPKRLHALLRSPPRHLLANPGTTVGVVNVVYPLPPSAVHPDGFGYLIPHTPGSSNPEGALGVVFDSTALPGMDGALEGKITKMTVMMGGPHWGSYTSQAPPAEAALPQLAISHLHRVFPHLKTTEPLLVSAHLNTECIPTYAPGHAARLAEMHADLVGSRVSVVGAGYTGVSVNDCVHTAEAVAKGLVAGESVTGLEAFAL